MSERDDMNFDVRLAIHNHIRKSPQRYTPDAALRADARKGRTETRMALDQLQCALNFREEFASEGRTLLFVPSDSGVQFVPRAILDTNGLAHLRRILVWI